MNRDITVDRRRAGRSRPCSLLDAACTSRASTACGNEIYLTHVRKTDEAEYSGQRHARTASDNRGGSQGTMQ
jgi:hypothetical protein